MSDTEDNCSTIECDYIAKENELMKKNYALNCTKLFTDVYSFIKGQDSPNFCISQIKFSTGDASISLADTLVHIAQEMQNKSNARIASNKVAIEKAEKAGRPRPQLSPFTPFDELQIVLHNYGISDNGVYVQNNNELVQWLMKKISGMLILDSNDVYTLLYIPKSEINALSFSDNIHKLAFEFYINAGRIQRDTEEELIFGDELL
jgi:hypothetical protein